MTVAIELSEDEALVLFELVHRVTHDETFPFKHAAERRVLDSVESQLEATLVAPLDAEYLSLLAMARERIGS